MQTYKIHLLRSGSAQEENTHVYMGQTDWPLSYGGAGELEQLLQQYDYPTVQRVYTSPLMRCVQTADMLYPNTQLAVLDGLKDLGLGVLEGHTLEELRELPEFYHWVEDSKTYTPPGGETVVDFAHRIEMALEQVFYNMMDEGLTNVGVITHGGVIMTLLGQIGLPKQPLEQWATAHGTGYTLLATPQLWMQQHAMEVYSYLPLPQNTTNASSYDWLS